MTIKRKSSLIKYNGFEQGPIRPPSEAASLLLRISRNCPWNHCTFCPVYKGSKFSLRPVEHVIKDIDSLSEQVEILQNEIRQTGTISMERLNQIRTKIDSSNFQAFNAAVNWLSNGMESIFIQDANSLVIKPSDLMIILKHIKKSFPWVKRVTSYARSHTLARISDDNLKKIADAGLNRIHIGLESASDNVLEMVKKGATKQIHITAGKKVKNAGMELSEYVMPGLGGQKYSKEHALETADALNQINPDFIRLRTLALPRKGTLADDYNSGLFQKCTDFMMAKEILLFLENLSGITSYVKSDHILNLLEEIDGKLPEDKDKLCKSVTKFLEMDPENRMYFQVGRRVGILSCLDDLKDNNKLDQVKNACSQYGINQQNVDSMIDEMMKRFV